MADYHWTNRARFHGRRLFAEGRELSPSLIGSLAYHEGANVTVQAVADFSRELRSAYETARIEAGEV